MRSRRGIHAGERTPPVAELRDRRAQRRAEALALLGRLHEQEGFGCYPMGPGPDFWILIDTRGRISPVLWYPGAGTWGAPGEAYASQKGSALDFEASLRQYIYDADPARRGRRPSLPDPDAVIDDDDF